MQRQNQDEDDFGSDGTETTYGSTSGGPSRPALVQLPRPSVLNTMHVNNLRTVVQKVLFLQHTPPIVGGDDDGATATLTETPSILFSKNAEKNVKRRTLIVIRRSLSNIIRGQLKRASRNQALREWGEDNDVRGLYDLPAPAELDEKDDDDLDGQCDSLDLTSAATKETTIDESQQLLPK
jgi:hypothetical protein